MTIRETKYFLDNQEFTPANIKGLGFRGDLRQNPEFAEFSSDRITIKGEASTIITQHISSIGIFEGIPLTVKMGTFELELYVDLRDNLIIREANSYAGIYEYEVTVKKRWGLDTFRERAKGLSWRAINRTNPIPNFDVPFLIVREDMEMTLITLLISTFILVKEAIEAVKRLVEETAELINVSTTDPVAGVGGGVVIKIGGIIKQALIVVAVLAYVVLLSIAIRALIEQILDLIFPKIRNLKGCKVRDLMLKLCEKTGYTLISNFLDSLSPLTILPVPYKSKDKSWWEQIQSNITEYYNEGFPTEQDSIPNGLALVEFLESFYNVEVRASNGIVRIEPTVFFENSSNVTIQHNLNDQENLRDVYSPNSDEIWKRYLLRHEVDGTDSNTYDFPNGTAVEMDTSPITINNPDLVSIDKIDERASGFALGRRKTDFTFLEREAYKIAQEADKILKTFGLNTNLTAKIQARKGVLQISQPYFSITKLMWTTGGRQPSNYLDYIGCKAIYDKYHVTNQYKFNANNTFPNMPTQFDPDVFSAFFENRFLNLSTGSKIEVLDYELLPEEQQMTITYAKDADYGNNTKVTLIHA